MINTHHISILCLCMIHCLQVHCSESINEKLYQHLQKNYNRRIRPQLGIKPVEVQVSIYVTSLRSISEQTMDYKLELYFREYWKDMRLEFARQNIVNVSKLNLHESLAEMLWVPPTVLSHWDRCLAGFYAKFVLGMLSISVTAECPMDLSLYPFDVQVCLLSIESYGSSTDDIFYTWKKDAVVLNEHLQLPVFRVKEVITKNRNITLATGTYSRLECCFFFIRSPGFYFVQIFIPAAAIVTTAWLSLWMEKDSEFSDMIEIILAITFLYYSYSTLMPKVSYIKAMDIFLGTCFIFVFTALVQLAVTKLMHQKLEKRIGERKKDEDSAENGTYYATGEDCEGVMNPDAKKHCVF